MSRRKTERLLGLVVCLLSARRYLTANQIRAAVPGYPESFDAFKRMFERDKDELRALGIPLETGTVGDDESGYRISRQAYELPDIRLEPDEVAMLGLAARVWRRAELAGAADGALLKLRAAGIDAESLSQPRIEPRVQTAEPAFGPLWEAVRDQRPVTFGYRVPGRGAAQLRSLEPWGVVCRRGRWYVVGQDTDRGAERVFRLSRIDGPVRFSGPPGSVTVPPGTDVRAAVRDGDREASAPRSCLLRVRAGAGHGLRRYAERIEAERADGTGEATGWDLVELGYSDTPWWSEHIASFGADVVVLEPSDLRDAVIGRLKGAGVTTRGSSGTVDAPARPGPAGPRAGRAGPDRPATVTATERLQRLLALVPYVVSRNVTGMAETAAAFGITERELVDDLNLLWCVELRSPDPYCPIDLSYEGGEIVISEAEAIDRPLRLGVDEACALLIALRMLAELPSVGESSALTRTIAKLEAAAGAAAGPSGQVAVQVDDVAAQSAAAQVADALSSGRRLHISYYVPGRDEATERDVDPMRLLVVEGRSYLEGWCRRADAVRLFRLDRILAIQVLDVPKDVPAGAEHRDVDHGLFRPSPLDVHVELEIGPAARWVAEYYSCERVEQLADGWLRLRLRTPDTQLVRRLALRLGEDGRLVSPPDLSEQVLADAMAALANYE